MVPMTKTLAKHVVIWLILFLQYHIKLGFATETALKIITKKAFNVQ